MKITLEKLLIEMVEMCNKNNISVNIILKKLDKMEFIQTGLKKQLQNGIDFRKIK